MHLLHTNISVVVGGNGVLELGFSLHLCLLKTPFCNQCHGISQVYEHAAQDEGGTRTVCGDGRYGRESQHISN